MASPPALTAPGRATGAHGLEQFSRVIAEPIATLPGADGEAFSDEDFAAASARAHPHVRALFAALRDGELADARLVFRTLAARFPAEPGTEHQQRCAAGLIEYHRRTGRMGRRGYDDWVRELPAPHPFLSSSALRNAFGKSWDDVKSAVFGVPIRDLKAIGLNTMSSPFEDQELLDLVSLWAQHETRPLLFRHLPAWAAQAVGDPNLPVERYPATASPFGRFGGWKATLAKLGLLERRLRAGARELTGPSVGPEHYAPERKVEVLRAAATALGTTMSAVRYGAWAADRVNRALDAGVLLTLPSFTALIQTWGTWPKALHAADLIDDAELARRSKRGFYTDEELVDFLIEAMREFGTGCAPRCPAA